MSMPEINLEEILPRDALAAVMASIALQEAAVAHVLNAEGEKIQAVVGMADATLEELQGINESVGDLTDSVSSLTGEMQRKLRTAMEALYPGMLPEITATLTVRIVDEDGVPLNAAGAQFILFDSEEPPNEFASFPVGSSIRFNNIPPGLYTLQQITAPEGHEIDPNEYPVVVLSDGSILFDGADASIHIPTITNETTVETP
ncbi:MAG: prealbumin-like fold domain-containing protein [Oscillospiraceae bacterium]|nr:prealbumin-like fold domain-containing protein [Oscillospiraceae bacterium]